MVATVSAFQGREREIRLLDEAVVAARSGEPAFVLVSGETGIGKTRLLQEWLRGEAAHGTRVLWGGSPPVVGADLPLAPLAEMLRPLVRDDPTLADQTPELFRTVTGRGVADREHDAHSVLPIAFEQVLGLVGRIGMEHGLAVMVFEDAHWADPSTLDLLGFLFRNLRAAPVLVAITQRTGELDAGGPLRRLNTELRRAGAVDIAVGPLDREKIASAVRERMGDHANPSLVNKVVALADGNPYFAEELADEAGSGGTDVASVRDVIRQRVDMLDPAARHVLALASVAGREIRPELLWATAGMPEDTVSASIKTLLESGVLERVRGASGEVLRIRHALVREVAYDAQLPPERAQRHHLIARALTANGQMGVGRAVDTTIETALHWRAAGDVFRAFPALVRAAQAAEAVYAFREASALYFSALSLEEQMARTTEPARIGFQQPVKVGEEMVELTRRAAEAASLAGDPERASNLVDGMLSGRPEHESPNAGLLIALGRYRYESGALPEARSAYQRATTATSDAGERTRALAGLARVLLALGERDEAARTAIAAVDASDVDGSVTNRRLALAVLALTEATNGANDEALSTLSRARALADSAGTQSVIRPRPSRVMDLVSAFGIEADALRTAGQKGEARLASQNAAATAGRFGAVGPAAGLALDEAEEKFEMGEWAASLQACESVIGGGAAVAAGRALCLRARINAWRGGWEIAGGDLATVEASMGRSARSEAARFQQALAELRLWRREINAADEAASAAVVLPALAAEPNLRAEMLELALAVAAERAIEAKATSGKPVTALTDRLLELTAELDAVIAGTNDPRRMALGAAAKAHAARVTGQSAEAWRDVADRWRVLGAVPREAVARYRLAEAIAETKGSRAGASAELRRAYELANVVDAEPLREEIRLLAQRARWSLDDAVHVEAARPAKRPPGPHGLSRREEDVLRLVSIGRTNKQIADELFLSEKTVGHHVSSILGKLGVSSRVEAAGIAFRLGLGEVGGSAN